jgi:hypothetical protein
LGGRGPGWAPRPAALARARDATAGALAACELPAIVGHQGILRLVLVALGELAPEDYFSRRLHEADPIVIEAPSVVGP